MRTSLKRLQAFAIDYLVIALYLGLLSAAILLLQRVGVDLFGVLPSVAARQGLGVLLLTLPVTLYFALSEGTGARATLGKHRMGLRLIGPDGKPLRLPRSLLRSLAKFLPWELAHTAVWRLPQHSDDPVLMIVLTLALSLALGYLTALFLGNGRTPYDRLAGSRVEAT